MASLSARASPSLATSALLPFFAQTLPMSDPLGDLGLESPCAWLVEGLGAHFLRPVIVPGKGILLLVIVAIAFAIADVLHEARGRVEDRLGRHQRAGLLRCLPCS